MPRLHLSASDTRHSSTLHLFRSDIHEPDFRVMLFLNGVMR